ncbi:MAG: hypothetical protein QGH80_07350, partial [Acidimicrobiales bacterium]|nr:hypothetical protein [Acidimicrobiales bacterium]
MKRCLTLWVFPLIAAACSYGTNTSSQTERFTSNLSDKERACVEDRLLMGWDLNLTDLNSDLSPDEEMAVDMATELCRLTANNSPVLPPTDNEKPQVSEELLQAPSMFSSTDAPPGEDPLLDQYWLECGLGDARACD